MDIGFIVAPCSRLGRAGSLSRAGRGTQALQVLARRGFHYPAQAHTPMGARSSAAPGKEGRAGDVERGGLWRRGRGRERLRRGNCRWAISSRSGSTRKGLSGNFGGAGPGGVDAAVPGPGQVPRCAREPARVPRAPAPSCSLPSGLRGKKNPPHYRDTEAHF